MCTYKKEIKIKKLKHTIGQKSKTNTNGLSHGLDVHCRPQKAEDRDNRWQVQDPNVQLRNQSLSKSCVPKKQLEWA
jgi:hypothetical protein